MARGGWSTPQLIIPEGPASTADKQRRKSGPPLRLSALITAPRYLVPSGFLGSLKARASQGMEVRVGRPGCLGKVVRDRLPGEASLSQL